jgi:choline kinase
MKAVILAAGASKRLIPLTNNIPKCLIKVSGKPILQYQLEAIIACGMRNVVIVIGYHGNKIIDFLERNRDIFSKLTIKCINNEIYDQTNSGYSLWLAREEVSEGFYYFNADLIFFPDLLKKLVSSPYENAIVIDRDMKKDSYLVKASVNNKNGTIKDMSWDISGDALAVGPLKFSREGASKVVSCLDSKIKSGVMKSYCYLIFGELARGSLVLYGVNSSGSKWLEIDTHADLARGELLFKDKA